MATTLNLYSNPLSLTLRPGELIYVWGPESLNLDLNLELLLPEPSASLMDKLATLEPNSGWNKYRQPGNYYPVKDLLLERLEGLNLNLDLGLLLEAFDLKFAQDAPVCNLSPALALRLYILDLLLEGKQVFLLYKMRNLPKLDQLLTNLKLLLKEQNLLVALLLIEKGLSSELENLADRTEYYLESPLPLRPGAAA